MREVSIPFLSKMSELLSAVFYDIKSEWNMSYHAPVEKNTLVTQFHETLLNVKLS